MTVSFKAEELRLLSEQLLAPWSPCKLELELASLFNFTKSPPPPSLLLALLASITWVDLVCLSLCFFHCSVFREHAGKKNFPSTHIQTPVTTSQAELTGVSSGELTGKVANLHLGVPADKTMFETNWQQLISFVISLKKITNTNKVDTA